MMSDRVTRRWLRFRALEGRDRWLVAEAVFLIGVIQVCGRLMPFGALRGLLARAKRFHSTSRHLPTQIGWAVNAAARVVPGRTCLSDALAADVMLCRRGYESALRLGVKKRDDGAVPLQAHAWVECNGSIVAGELERLDEYRLFPHTGGAA